MTPEVELEVEVAFDDSCSYCSYYIIIINNYDHQTINIHNLLFIVVQLVKDKWKEI